MMAKNTSNIVWKNIIYAYPHSAFSIRTFTQDFHSMSNILDQTVGLIFGSDTGNTEEMGDRMSAILANKGIDVEMINR